jgi:hypothetical protein
LIFALIGLLPSAAAAAAAAAKPRRCNPLLRRAWRAAEGLLLLLVVMVVVLLLLLRVPLPAAAVEVGEVLEAARRTRRRDAVDGRLGRRSRGSATTMVGRARLL